MTRDEWIAEFALRAGVPRPSAQEIRALLELAGTAAHASERTAAPLACWIAGRSAHSLAELQALAAEIGGAEAPAPGGDGPARGDEGRARGGDGPESQR